MDRYVGLDAHAESCTLGVMGPSGKRLKSPPHRQLADWLGRQLDALQPLREEAVLREVTTQALKSSL